MGLTAGMRVIYGLRPTAHCCHPHSQDLAKKLKDQTGGLDLMGYIELQRWVQAP